MSNIALGLYEYVDGVNDTPFPSSANQAFLVDWQYGARRMGGAPSITGGTIRHEDCLDDVWTEDVYVEYKGEKFFANHKPTSSYSSQEVVYEHKVDFYSERLVLDNVYFYDVVSQGDSGGKPISNSAKFTFFGNITEFIARLNASMQRSNTGYSVVLDPNQENADLEKQIKFDTKYISEALQEGFKAFGIPYYFVGKVCHFGDSQSSAIDNIVFQYGRNKSLLSIEKTNANTKIINRITGTGSADNIPYYYPNSCEQGVVEIDELTSSTITNLEITDDMIFAKKVKKDAILTYNLYSFGIETPYFYLDDKAYKDGKGFSSDEITQGVVHHVVVPFEVKYDGCTDLFLRFGVEPVATTISNLAITPSITGVTPTTSYGKVYVNAVNKSIAKGKYQLSFDVNISPFSLILQVFKMEACTIYANGWKDNKDGNFFHDLEEIGISMTGYASPNDHFKQIIEKYIAPQPNLMPSIYRESEGEERFYNAVDDTYENPDTGEYYEFPNPYVSGKPKEYIKDYKDVKPTIAGVLNAEDEPIDQIIKFAYDENDNDDLEEDGVTYKHPYFFALLHRTNGTYGFNLFDHTIDEGEMSLSFTSGRMGGCEFVIGVGEDSQKNTVQIVLDANLQPELDENGHPILLRDENGNVVWGREEQGKQIPQEWQNDTKRNEVWVALKKDVSTYGIVMPNATNEYRPDDSEVNEFVILHIDLPKAYILAAEKSLENSLIAYMAESNTEHWNFSIDFSRIYFKENSMVATALDENKKIKIKYHNKTYIRYVLGYTYKTLIGEPLPSISVDLAESLESSTSPFDTAINEINDMVEQQALAMIGYQQVARLARGALQASNVEGAGSSTRPIYFDGHEAKVVNGLEVPESIRTQKNVEAMWGVSSRGIATLETAGAGGGGTVTGINFAGSPSQIYTPSAGLITLPDYPSLDGYATQNWVTTNFADKAYESRVIAIGSLIPAQATSSNQLADKAFVNSSIATNTATFRGTYESVADLPDSTDIPDLKNNDYAFVIGLVSSNPEYKRYKYTNGSWAYEYTLNNSSFTAAQWASITSGITSDKVSAYDTHIARTDNPHSVTKAQVGLGNVENTKLSTWAGTANITTLGTIGTGIWHGTAIADDYIASAAAWNAKYDKPSGGIPKTDLASAVQTSLGKADTALQSHQTIYNLIIKKNGTQVGSTYNPASAAQTIDITDVASANALSGVSTRVGTLEGYFSDGLLKKANHYSPASDSSADYSASASGATAAWSIDVVKAVQIQRDAKGHVLGVTVTSGKIPAKPTYAFSDLTSHPTTLSGYGITDGVNGLQKSGSGYLSGVDFVEGNPHSLAFTFTSFAKAQIGHTGGSGTTTYKVRVKADGAWSDYLALQEAGASAWGVVTDQAQTFGGDKTFNGNIHGMKGVSARGIATLEMAGGGGAGTVTSIQFGSGTVISANNGLLSVSVGQGTSNGQIKIGGQDVAVKGLAALAFLPSLAFGDLTTHPTTLGGYGITDAKIANGVITLGSNSITPLTGINASIINTALGFTLSGTSGQTYNLATISSNASNGNTAYGYFSNGVLPASKGGTGKTSLSDAGSAIINALGVGSSPASREDYIVAQYAGGGTTTTSYYRRKLSNIFAALNSGDITTALGYTPYNATNPNGYISGNQTITLSGDVSGSGTTSIAVTIGAGKVTNAMLAGSIANSKLASAGKFTIGNTAIELGTTYTAANFRGYLGLGGAATYGATSSVTDGGTSLVTSGGVYSYVNALLTAAMKIEGETTTAISDGSTTNPVVIGGQSVSAYKGMVVFYGSKEFVWVGTNWKELGDESSFALKTTTVSGTGYLTGGGALSSNQTIDIASSVKTKIDNGATAYGWGNHANAGYALASNLGTASTHAHSDYVTAIGTSGNTLTWSKGGTAQTSITVPYATMTNGLNMYNGTRANLNDVKYLHDGQVHHIIEGNGVRGLHFSWDSGCYDTQILIPEHRVDSTAHLKWRSNGADGVWENWMTILDSDNYTTYTVKKDGKGASGTWGISITGSAASCTGNAATATDADKLNGQHGSYYATASSVTTLQGYFTSGVAKSAAKLTTVSKTAWGRTYWTSGGVPDNISGDMSNVGNIAFSASGKNIGGLLYFDTTNARLGVGVSSPLYKLHVGGDIVANGGVAARGIVTLDTSGAGISGAVTQINVGSTPYTPSAGIVSLPASFPASDVSAWAKASSRPTYTTSIETSAGTNQRTLAFGTKYALNAGDTSYIFTMPSLPSASTSQAGVVQLSSATNSTSTSLAATASAVKAAYDLASEKASKRLAMSTSTAASLTMSASTDASYIYWYSNSVTSVSLAQATSAISADSCGTVHYILFRNVGNSQITVTLSKYNNSNYQLISPAKSFVIPASSSVEISYVHIAASALRMTVVTIGDIMSSVS